MRFNRNELRRMILIEVRKLQETHENRTPQEIKNEIAFLEGKLREEQALYRELKLSHPLYSGEDVDDWSYYDDILTDMANSEDRSANIQKEIDSLKRQLAILGQPDGGDIGYGNMPRF